MSQLLTILETKDLTVGYRTKQGVRAIAGNLHLRLQPGRLVCLLGPNGSGKSTLLRTLAGLQAPLAGEILINGQSISAILPQALAKLLSLVLTDRTDTGNLTVQELIAIGRTPHTGWLGTLDSADRSKIAEAARLARAESLINRKIHELSDGERQKVMLARALCQDTPLILLDEPTAHLDLVTRVEMMALLSDLSKHTQKSILLSTHDLDLALRMSDELWLMGTRNNVLVGTPEDLVLNGSFQSIFSNAGLDFNTSTGTFEIKRRNHLGTIFLSGTEKLVFWTGRALERQGFETVRQQGQAANFVDINQDGDEILWTIRSAASEIRVSSIRNLLHYFQETTYHST